MQAFCVLISSEKEMFAVRKKSNRVFSILLTLVMLLGMLPAPAQAAIERIAQRFLGESVPMPSFSAKKRGFFFWRKKQEPLSL